MGNENAGARAKILVATDLSAAADEALRQAHEWAARLGCDLLVCHVIPSYHRMNPLFPQRNETDGLSTVDFERRVADLVTRRMAEVTGLRPDAFGLVIDVGRPEASIIRTAMTTNVDMVVMGSSGDTGLSRILLGGVSEQVVRHAHCSVLVARPALGRGRVLAATDFSDSSFPAITVGASEAERRHARLVVMHNLDIWPLLGRSAEVASGPTVDRSLVEEQRVRATQGLGEILARLEIEADCLVTDGPAEVSIVQAADDLRPELLVIGTHGRTGLARLALGSVAERVVEAASCSVLVVRLEAEG